MSERRRDLADIVKIRAIQRASAEMAAARATKLCSLVADQHVAQKALLSATEAAWALTITSERLDLAAAACWMSQIAAEHFRLGEIAEDHRSAIEACDGERGRLAMAEGQHGVAQTLDRAARRARGRKLDESRLSETADRFARVEAPR